VRHIARIEGFTCYIQDTRVRDAITIVLRQIKERHPKDFARLREKVRGFRWLPRSEDSQRSGTLGQWMTDDRAKNSAAFKEHVEKLARMEIARSYGFNPKSVHPEHVRLVADAKMQDRHTWPGKVAISRRLIRAPRWRLLAVLAHELGHAATNEDDLNTRFEEIGNSEWASEGCADYYAYRWGFGREIRRHSPERDFGHHGGLPGEIINPFNKTWFRVTRNFHYHPVDGPE